MIILLQKVKVPLVVFVSLTVLTGLVWTLLTEGLTAENLAVGAFGMLALPVGVALVLRVETNLVSWVMLAVAFGVGLMGLGTGIGNEAVSILVAGIGLFGLVLPGVGVFLPLWFPTGAPPSPRWRWVGILGSLGLLAIMSGSAVAAATGDWDASLVCSSPGGCVAFVGMFAILLAVIGAVASLIVRWRRSTGNERLQLRWLVPAFAVLGLGLLAEFGGLQDSIVANTLLPAGSLLLMLAIALAVLRYRLYEIDRLISRTLTYALVVGSLALIFTVPAVGLPLLIDLPENNPLLVAAATLVAAALFNPLRRNIQTRVDRRFNRSKYDTQQEIERFVERLRHEVSVDEVTNELLNVVAKTMHPRGAAVWIRSSPGAASTAAAATAAGEATTTT